MHILRCENNLLTGSVINAKIFKFGFIFFIAAALPLITVRFDPAYMTVLDFQGKYRTLTAWEFQVGTLARTGKCTILPDLSMRNSSGALLGKLESYFGW